MTTMEDASPSYYGRPFVWLTFALALSYVPLVGYMVKAGLAWDAIHPALNAILNGTSTVFLIVGYFAIRRRNTELHWRCMVAAFVSSSVFLASYLARFYMSGTHRYPGADWDKTLYLVILFSHMALAIVAVPAVLRLLWLARSKQYGKHRKLARWAWPVWVYVSVTGVVVYLMLYPIAGALYGN